MCAIFFVTPVFDKSKCPILTYHLSLYKQGPTSGESVFLSTSKLPTLPSDTGNNLTQLLTIYSSVNEIMTTLTPYAY